MAELLPIQIDRCRLSRVGAEFTGDITVSEWMEVGRKLHAIGSCYQFLLGDWLNFGERAYGEKYKLACEQTGMDYQTLANYAWVCAKIEIYLRKENLSFGHHNLVAGMPESEREKWLDNAANGKWSIADMREAIRKAEAQYAGEDHGKPVVNVEGFISRITRAISGVKPEEWTSTQRFQYRELLKPIVDFYQRL